MDSLTTERSQTAPENALLALFTSGARVAVLKAFLLDPNREYYQRQIETATGLPIRAIQRELERLTQASLLYRRAEGNRTYYRVDTDYPLFPELRSIVLKTADAFDHLRGVLAVASAVRLALLNEAERKVLVVIGNGQALDVSAPAPFVFDVMFAEEFTKALAGGPLWLEPYLAQGADLLGRREDIIWRHIEAAGYEVQKGRGVP